MYLMNSLDTILIHGGTNQFRQLGFLSAQHTFTSTSWKMVCGFLWNIHRIPHVPVDDHTQRSVLTFSQKHSGVK